MFFAYLIVFGIFMAIPIGTIIFSWNNVINAQMTIQFLVFAFLAFFLFFSIFPKIKRFVFILSSFAVIFVGLLHFSYNLSLEHVTALTPNGATRLKTHYLDRADIVAKRMLVDNSFTSEAPYSYYNVLMDNYGVYFTETFGGLICLDDPDSDYCEDWANRAYKKIEKDAGFQDWIKSKNKELSRRLAERIK